MVYMAIRAPMMVEPEAGTEVYQALARTGTGATTTVTGVGFAPDLVNVLKRDTGGYIFSDRLRGRKVSLQSTTTGAETTSANVANDIVSYDMDGVTIGANWNIDVNSTSSPHVDYFFKRAKGFFDVVAYSGTGVAKTEAHSLGVAPEMMFVKSRSHGSLHWMVYHTGLNITAHLFLNDTHASQTDDAWNSTAPTDSLFSVKTYSGVNLNNQTYIAYLFATLDGISKVGSYTGNGSNQNIACGFSAGARFVLIKRTDATGDWYIWDTTRGIVTGNDPHLSLNTTAAEVTTDDSIDPQSAGFTVNQLSATNINVSSATYIFLAIA
jgi:hypothetical protein